MRIDSTRYKAFTGNPEAYRLKYCLNLAPKQLSYGIERGTAFHTYLDHWHKGQSDDDITDLLLTNHHIPQETVNKALLLAKLLRDKYRDSGIITLLSEQEFEYQIPGSPHSIVGKIDHIIQRDDQILVGDYKTANAKKRFAQLEEQWKDDVQADFYLLGARSLGYHTNHFLVRTIAETTPPSIWEIPVQRSNYRLALMERYVHIICETILQWTQSFGINEPWPHFTNWPCSGDKKWCDVASTCEKEFCSPLVMPDGFQERKEHLEIMQ